jgi:L-histidine Nalpha-methyltransferase
VTARFNLNLLVRINRELGGNFDPAAFRHRAVYHADEGRIAMYLVSERRQTASIERLGLEVSFAAGEAIHTEDSFKYSIAEIDALAARAGFRVDARWLDGARRFSLSLLRP